MPSPDYHYQGCTCSVYAISDGHGNIKVGVANRVDRRIKQMQTGNAHPLQLLFECVCESERQLLANTAAFTIEHWIHEDLRLRQMTGEWFSVDYQEAYKSLCHVVDWFRAHRKDAELVVHDIHVHAYEHQHVWYWPTSDVYERGLVQ